MKTQPPPGYGVPTRILPEWTAAYFSFQAGIARTRVSSLTGGGDVYVRMPGPPGPPVIVRQVAALTAINGGGVLPARPYFFQGLIGNGAQSASVGNGM